MKSWILCSVIAVLVCLAFLPAPASAECANGQCGVTLSATPAPAVLLVPAHLPPAWSLAPQRVTIRRETRVTERIRTHRPHHPRR